MILSGFIRRLLRRLFVRLGENGRGQLAELPGNILQVSWHELLESN